MQVLRLIRVWRVGQLQFQSALLMAVLIAYAHAIVPRFVHGFASESVRNLCAYADGWLAIARSAIRAVGG